MSEPGSSFGSPLQPAAALATLGGGSLRLHVGYQQYDKAVLLMVLQQFGHHPPTLWRSFWSPFHNAVDQLEELVGCCLQYMEDLGVTLRPEEDFDVEDVVEHLQVRLKNAFH